MIIYEVINNDQRDNPNWGGKFKSIWQCFSTSIWMLITYFIFQLQTAGDEGLKFYVDDVEANVGKKGIAEKFRKKHGIFTSFYWPIQRAGFEKWMQIYGMKGTAVFENIPFDKIPEYLKKYGPIVIGTKKIGGLSGGHIMLAIGNEPGYGIRCNDPYGDANTNYRETNGAGVLYHYSYLRKHTGESVRVIYWKGEN